MNQDIPSQQSPTVVQPTPQPATQESQQVVAASPKASQKPSKKKILFVVFFLILIAAGLTAGYLLLLQKPEPETQEVTTVTTPPTNVPISPSVAHFVGSKTITLSNLSDSSPSGSATLNIDPDNVTISIDVGLLDPPEGQFYQGWVLKTDEDYRSIGTLLKNNNGRYIATKSTKVLPTDYFEPSELYNIVVISLETIEDNTIETRVLEGTFTQ